MVSKNLSYSILLTEKLISVSNLHFVRFLEKSLWKSPDLTPPPTSQSDPRPESPDNVQELVVYLGNRDQSKTNTQTLRKKVTNQTSPYLEIIFFMNTPYISNVNQNPGLLPIPAASVTVGAPAPAW